MTKRVKKFIALGFCGLTLTSTAVLAATTYYFSRPAENIEKSNNNDHDHEVDDNSDSNSITENKPNSEYPETARNLKDRIYPFADESFKYYYANIHQYFYSEPKWDDLIYYRNMLPDYYNASNQFDIKQNVLYDNLRKWISNAIYMHPFFKNNNDKLFLDIDYKVNVLQKNILINVIWWFGANNSSNKYWDQIIVTLQNHLL